LKERQAQVAEDRKKREVLHLEDKREQAERLKAAKEALKEEGHFIAGKKQEFL
jgi:hypothetical protein